MQPHDTDNNQWFYIDTQGNEQGPFQTHEMTAWFSQGYFPDSLLVRKRNTLLVPLTSLTALNSNDPFKAPAISSPLLDFVYSGIVTPASNYKSSPPSPTKDITPSIDSSVWGASRQSVVKPKSISVIAKEELELNATKPVEHPRRYADNLVVDKSPPSSWSAKHPPAKIVLKNENEWSVVGKPHSANLKYIKLT